jgi:hypothetical protein
MIAALVLSLTGSLALAFDFPPDADFIVTDTHGVIVALGRSVGGTAVAMEVWSGFEGPAQLTLFLPDGTTRGIEVEIEGGVVAVAGVDLRALLARVFQDVALRFVAEPGEGADVASSASDGASAGGAQGIGPDGNPPGQDRRPEEPPGQDRRPEEPPDQDRKPEDPPGQDRKPEDPPGQDGRPDGPPGADRAR